MDNRIPQTPPIEMRPETGGLRKKIIIISAIAIAVIVVVVLAWPYIFVENTATIKTEILDTEEAYEPSSEALMRNLEGTDRQHLYSTRGTALSINDGIINFEIEDVVIRDDKQFISYREMKGEITDDTSIEKFVSTDDSIDLILIPAKALDIKAGSELEFHSYQNIFGIDQFKIEKLYILSL